MRTNLMLVNVALVVAVGCGTPAPPPAPPPAPVVVAPPPPPANIPSVPTQYDPPLFAKDQVMSAVVRNRHAKARVYVEPKDEARPVADIDDGVAVSVLALPDVEWAMVEDAGGHKGYLRRRTLAAFPFRALLNPAAKAPITLLHEPKADAKVDETVDINAVHMVDVTDYAAKTAYAHVILDGGSKADGYLATSSLDLYPPRDTPWRKDARLLGDLPLVDYTPTAMDATGHPTAVRVEAHATPIRNTKLPYGTILDVGPKGELKSAHLPSALAIGDDTLPAGTTLDFADECTWHVHLPADGTLGGQPVKWSDAPCLTAPDLPPEPEPAAGEHPHPENRREHADKRPHRPK